jgi:ubiquinone/menaquinone biosynthesis C-methylase UbiE
MTEAWRVWDNEAAYGELLYERAIGKQPEMESSKALANLMRDRVRTGDKILDVGCGAGHYLRSLRREIDVPFTYTGVDATAGYIELARKAWAGETSTRFEVGDVFALPFGEGEFDLVFSCNLLLHLPSIKTPMREIVRVAKSEALIRTLVGDRSFRIKDVHGSNSDADEFAESGEPNSFHFFNIYSRRWVERNTKRLPGVKSVEIRVDEEYDPARLSEVAEQSGASDVTRMLGNWQVNGYILMPWAFILIEKN